VRGDDGDEATAVQDVDGVSDSFKGESIFQHAFHISTSHPENRSMATARASDGLASVGCPTIVSSAISNNAVAVRNTTNNPICDQPDAQLPLLRHAQQEIHGERWIGIRRPSIWISEPFTSVPMSSFGFYLKRLAKHAAFLFVRQGGAVDWVHIKRIANEAANDAIVIKAINQMAINSMISRHWSSRFAFFILHFG
jgi:hypothetical protein